MLAYSVEVHISAKHWLIMLVGKGFNPGSPSDHLLRSFARGYPLDVDSDPRHVFAVANNQYPRSQSGNLPAPSSIRPTLYVGSAHRDYLGPSRSIPPKMTASHPRTNFNSELFTRERGRGVNAERASLERSR